LIKFFAYPIGKLYHLSLGYPALTQENSRVEGYFLTLHDPTVLGRLDRLEDYTPDRLTVNSYLLAVISYQLSVHFLLFTFYCLRGNRGFGNWDNGTIYGNH
jgi:gamma-glutamylcyclotransferase (GGCT)/AIG2-like uncharacterized protein YtfP